MTSEEVRKLLLLNLTQRVIIPLNELVEWDRYGIKDNGGFIFGWLKREDGFYDFVCISFELTQQGFLVTYNTSSKEHSKEMADIIYKGSKIPDEYLECKSAGDIPEANLVGWQKKIRELMAIWVIGILLTSVLGIAAISGALASSGVINRSVVSPTKGRRYAIILDVSGANGIRREAYAVTGGHVSAQTTPTLAQSTFAPYAMTATL